VGREGTGDGNVDGNGVGADEGKGVGKKDGALGWSVGNGVGAGVGIRVGRGAGNCDGDAEGVGVGGREGASTGACDGSIVGVLVGGVNVGAGEGAQLDATTKSFRACKGMLVLSSSAFRIAASSEVVGSPQADTEICSNSYHIVVGCTNKHAHKNENAEFRIQ